MTRLLIKRSILSLKMAAVTLISAILLFHPLVSSTDLWYNFIHHTPEKSVNYLDAYVAPFAIGFFILFAGIFPGIPYAYSYLEEKNSGCLPMISVRMKRRQYIGQKVLLSGLSGGLTMLFPAMILFSFIMIAGSEVPADWEHPVWTVKIWYPIIHIWSGRFFLIIKAVLMFLFGAMWSEFSFLISLFVSNIYVAYILPFIIFEATWIIGERVGYFIPLYLIRADFDSSSWMHLGTPFLTLGIYILVIILLNIFVLRYRLTHQ